MIKFIEAKSCNQLFINCIILQMLFNTLFYIINLFIPWTSIMYIVSAILQVLLSLLLGLYLRRKNEVILRERLKKRYAIISIVGLVFLFIIIIKPNIIVMPYMVITVAIYNLTGLDRIFTLFDFISIFVCLSGVFFYSERLSRKFCKNEQSSNAQPVATYK